MTTNNIIPRRMPILLPALLSGVVGLLTASSGAAADDCLAAPNALSPPGTHWYYRVDRTTHQKCWYLGAEGTRVRAQTHQTSAPAQPSAPARPHSAKPSTAASATAPAETKNADAGPDEVRPAEASAQAAATLPKPLQEAVSAAAFPIRTADARTAAIAVDANTSGPIGSDEQGQSATDSEDGMPLIWPVLSAEDLAAADHPSVSAFAHVAGLFAAVMGALALAGILFLCISTGRKPRRSAVRYGHSVSAYEAVDESEFPLAPSAEETAWAGTADTAPEASAAEHDAPQYPREAKVAELLAQLRRQPHPYDLEAMLAAAR